MGGVCSVIIRESDGRCHSLDCHTGSWNHLFFSKAFSQHQDSLAIENFLISTPSNLQKDTLSPSGYGLIIVDFKLQAIRSMQDYSFSIGDEHLSNLGTHVQQPSCIDWDFLFQNKLLQSFIEDASDPLHSCPPSILQQPQSFLSIQRAVDQSIRSSLSFESHPLRSLRIRPSRLSNWALSAYDLTPDGMLSLVRQMHQDGFPLTSRDLDLWIDYSQSFDPESFFSIRA